MPDAVLCTVDEFRNLTNERNRYKRALRRIAKGHITHNGTREEYTPHFCRVVALRALDYHPRRPKRSKAASRGSGEVL